MSDIPRFDIDTGPWGSGWTPEYRDDGDYCHWEDVAEAMAQEREACAGVNPRVAGLPGCGDHSCKIEKPTGMATNGGCRCDAGKAIRAMRMAIRAKGGMSEGR